MATIPVHPESAQSKRPCVADWESARDDAEELYALILMSCDSDLLDGVSKRGLYALAKVAQRHMDNVTELFERDYASRQAESKEKV